MMTGRERLLTAMRRGQPDRVPMRFWFNWRTPPAHPSYKRIVELAREHCDDMVSWGAGKGVYLSATDKASVKTTTRPSEHEDFQERVSVLHTPAGDLTQIFLVSTKGKPGYTKKHYIESVSDAKAFLSIPYVPIKPDVEKFFELERKIGDRAPILVTVSGDPMYTINAIMGSETFALFTVEHRELLHDMIAAMAQRWYDVHKMLLAAKVGPVFGYVGPELCIPPLQSPRDFYDFVVKYCKPLSDMVHDAGGLIWVHCHGRTGKLLEGFMEMGVDCLNPLEPPPMGDVDLAEAKQRCAGRMCLEGNVEIGDFQLLADEEFEVECARCITQGKPGGGFIYCPTSGPTHWPELDARIIKNYEIFVEVGLRLGKY